MQKIKLTKRWGDYKAGTVFIVLGDGVVLRRDGSVVDANGVSVKGKVVDATRAAELSDRGYTKKASRSAKR